MLTSYLRKELINSLLGISEFSKQNEKEDIFDILIKSSKKNKIFFYFLFNNHNSSLFIF